jgi:hypothetical protein
MPRPSGLSVFAEDEAPVIVAVTTVEKRGRLSIAPRWRKRIPWLTGSGPIEALMTFNEPGLITISDWKKDGPRIQQRFEELSKSDDADALEALRLIQDRFQRLNIPSKERPSLGDAALAHLGLNTERNRKFTIYICVYPDRVELLSHEYRNSKLLEGHPLIDDLP